MDIWLEAERELRGEPPVHGQRDPIPADPDRPDADSDPAVNPSRDEEFRSIGGPGANRSPTAFGV